MLINLTEVVENPDTKKFFLREVTINPRHVVAVRADDSARNALLEGRMSEGLNPQTHFSKLVIDAGQYGMNLTVVGTVGMIQEKLNSSKTLLKG